MSETPVTAPVVVPQAGTPASVEPPKPTPPWGTDEEFSPAKAWELIQDLRVQKNDPTVAKELEALRAEKAAREDAERTEAERAQVRITAAEEKAAETAAELVRTKAALKFHLSEEDAASLEGIPADRVEAIAERLAARPAVTPKAPPSDGQGAVGGGVHGENDPIKIVEGQIAAAETARNFPLAIQLKQQRSALIAAKD